MKFQDQVMAGIVLNREAMQSEGFSADPITGWRLEKTGDAFFYTVTIGGTEYTISSDGIASFDTVHASSDMFIGGDSVTDLIDAKPRGCIAVGNSANWTVDTASTSSTTALLCVRFDFSNVYDDRIYRLFCEYELIGTVTDDVFRTTVRYTVDGSDPTTGSAIWDGAEQRVTIPAGKRIRVQVAADYRPASDYDRIKTCIVIQRVSGTGTAKIECSDPNTSLRMSVEDIGRRSIATENAGIAQKSKSSGTPDPDPAVEYTKTYDCTWSRCWWATSPYEVFSTNGNCRQGFWPDLSTYLVSWFGFDSAQIATDLAGANVLKVELYLYFPYWQETDGGYAAVGFHWSTATSAPGYDPSKDTLQTAVSTLWPRTSGYWVDISSVGSFTLDGWRTGAHRGITLGQGFDMTSDYVGYAAGFSQPNAPKLRITYEN